MNSKQQYQKLFANLKGVGSHRLSRFVLPVYGANHVLEPVNCSNNQINPTIIDLLTKARNANSLSFLTIFNATPERTRNWLVGSVAGDPERILFMVRNLETGGFYGYMGLAFGNDDVSYIEADAIVRTESVVVRGLMKKAFNTMIEWVSNDLGIENIWVRVLSDNQAITFYESCGFVTHEVRPLFEVSDDFGDTCALTVEPVSTMNRISQRTLSYMKYIN